MSSSKEIIYKVVAIAILISTILYSFIPTIISWAMIVLVATFSAVTLASPYPGKSIRGKRLFGFQIVSCAFMITATYLMFKQDNLWALAMIVSAIFLLYSSIMIPKELKKENNKNV